MTKNIPEVSDLLDLCVVKISETIHKKEVTPRELESCVSMLISVDKNNREIRSTFTKDISNWTDEKLQVELKNIAVDESK